MVNGLRVVFALLWLVGCGDKEFSAPTKTALRVDANLFRLGAKSIEAAQASGTAWSAQPRDFLERQFRQGHPARPHFTTPEFSAPSASHFSVLDPAEYSATPAISAATAFGGGTERLIAVDSSGNFRSFLLGANSPSLCHTQTSLPAPAPGTSLALAQDGVTFYYASSGAGLVKGVESTGSCDGSPISTGANVVFSAASSGLSSTPWVDFNLGFVYFADTSGHINTYDPAAVHSGSASFSSTDSASAAVVFNSALWVGDDGGKLFKIPLDGSGVPNMGSNVTFDLGQAKSLSCGNCVVSTAFIDVSAPRIYVSMKNLLLGVNEANNAIVLTGTASHTFGTNNTAPTLNLATNQGYFAFVDGSSETWLNEFSTTASGSETASLSLGSGSFSMGNYPMVASFDDITSVLISSGTTSYKSPLGLSSSSSVDDASINSAGMVTDGTYIYYGTSESLILRGSNLAICNVNGDCKNGGTCNAGECTCSACSSGTYCQILDISCS